MAGHDPDTDRALIEDRFQSYLLMPLAAGQDDRDRPSVPLGAQMHLGRKPTLAATESLSSLRLTPRWRRLGGRRQRVGGRE